MRAAGLTRDGRAGERRRLLGFALLAASLMVSLPWLTAQVRNRDDEAFRAAREVFESGNDYAKARRMFEDIAAVKPEADLYIGRCHLELQDYDRAIFAFQSYVKNRPTDMEGRDYLGFAFARAGQPQAAMAVFEEQLKVNPNYSLATTNLADILVSLDRCAEAVPRYRRVLELLMPVEDSGALKGLGKCSLKLGRWNEALGYFQKATTLSKEDPEIFNGLGEAHQELDQIQDAVKMYSYALRLKPTDVAAGTRLADCYGRLARYEDQISTLMSVIRAGEKSARLFEALANAYFKTNQRSEAKRTFLKLHLDDPKNTNILVKLGRIHFEEGDYKEAKGYYEKALKIDPRLSEVLGDLAAVYEKEGNPGAARDAYYEGCKAAPASVAICLNLARLYLDAGEIPSARSELERIRSLDQESVPLKIELAKLSLAEGNLDQANEYMKEVLAKEPKSPHALLMAGRIAQEQGRLDDAITNYEGLLEVDPGNQSPYQDLTDLYLARDRWQELRDLGLRYLSRWPKDCETALRVAFAYQQLADSAKALEYYRKGFDLAGDASDFSSRAWAYNNYGALLFGAAEYDEASKALRKAISSDSNDQNANKNLGLVLAKLGRFEEAEGQLKRLQELQSPFEKELESFLSYERVRSR